MVNHNLNNQIGVVENPRVENGKLIASIRFTNDDLGKQYEEDVIDKVEDDAEDVVDAVENAESIEDAVDSVKDVIDVAVDDLEDLTVVGLKERLGELGLSTKGRKSELIARIKEHVEGSL